MVQRAASVFVIESPSAMDFLNEQHEGATLCSALKHAGINSQLFTVVNEDAFYETISRIGHAVLSGGDSMVPFVHLSMHGNEKGVCLTDRSEFSWEHLGTAMGVLNGAAEGRLFIAMSTCHGFSAAQMAHREDVPPYAFLIGPTENVRWRDTIAAFVAMYHHVEATRGGLTRAVEIMNAVLGGPKPLFASAWGTEEHERYVAQQADVKRMIDSYRGRMEADLGTNTGEGATGMRGLLGSLSGLRRTPPSEPD